jgi:hypothetical protein
MSLVPIIRVCILETRKRARCSVLNNARRGRYPWYVLHPRMDAGSNVSNGMISRQILVIVAPTVARSARRWIYHLGGLGFIPLGLLDSSVIPLPGSMDVLTIFLSARKQELWLYYGLMAMIGSVIGGYVTYRLARKGGKETLERKFPARTLDKVYRIFGRWGFGALGPSRSLPCCHRQRPWFHFSLPQAQCNIPRGNSYWR